MEKFDLNKKSFMDGFSRGTKIKICFGVFILLIVFGILFGFAALSKAEFKSEYSNTGGYEQPVYVNTIGYDNKDSYNNNVNYIEEFITGEERRQMVQGTDRNGNTVQAVVPVGVPEAEIDIDIKIVK